MITFSVPEYREECQHGLVGPGIEFEVSLAEESRFNPEVVTVLDTLIGPYIEPELETKGASKSKGAAGQLLGWVYRACRDADWPVFQLGTFEPEVGRGLGGRYYLPTRRTTPFLPFRLFRVLLTALLKDAGDWDRVAFNDEFLRLNRLLKVNGLSGSNQRWALLEALKRGHTATETTNNIFQIGQGKGARLIRGTVVQQSSQLLTEIQNDKVATARLLRLHGIPAVEHRRVHTEDEAIRAAAEIGYPVVLKPFNLNMGRGVVADIRSTVQLRKMLEQREFDLRTGLIEKYISGNMARIMIFEHQIIEVRVTELSHVIGDGVSSFEELTKEYAKEAYSDGNRCLKLRVDFKDLMKRMALIDTLGKNKIQLNSVIEAGKKIQILDHPTRRRGSRVQWLDGDELCEPYVKLASKINDLFGRSPIGIDLLNFDNEAPEQTVIGEVNFGPGLDFQHLHGRFLDVFEQGMEHARTT